MEAQSVKSDKPVRIPGRFDSDQWSVLCWWCAQPISLEGSYGDLVAVQEEHALRVNHARPYMRHRIDDENQERRGRDSFKEWLHKK